MTCVRVLVRSNDLEGTSYPLWTLSRAEVTRVAEEGGCVAPTGPAGSVIMFHGNLVHASPPNISPLPRTIVYLSLCHVENHIRAFKRQEWIAHHGFPPIPALPGDNLSELAAGDQAAPCATTEEAKNQPQMLARRDGGGARATRGNR